MAKRKLPNILTDDETQRLLEAPNYRYPTGYRNYCMLRLASETGMRISELMNLQIENIEWNTGQLAVRNGKGGKDRILYMRPEMLNELKTLRDRFSLGNTGNLFTTLDGKPLDAAYLRKMIKRMAERAGIQKRVYFHLLRHTMATATYHDTKDIRVVQEILGHQNISTTMVYTSISNDDVRKAMLR